MLIKPRTKMFITNTSSTLLLPILLATTKIKIIIPYYHMISDSDVLHIKHLYPHKTIKQFIDDIDYLLRNFQPIHLNDLLSHVKKAQELPPKALLLTFDDGFREMHDIVAPILLQKGIPATFFINSSFTDNQNLCYQHKASLLVEYLLKNNVSIAAQSQIESLLLHNNIQTANLLSALLSIKYQQRNLVDRIAEYLDINCNDYLTRNKPYLTSGEIEKMLQNGFAIGGHSIDHPLYADLTLEEQLRQTIKSASFVRNTFNLNYGAFAFPHSDTGVSRQFFSEINKSTLVDISFGTAGMITDCVPHSFQRFSMERPLMPAENIIAMQFAKKTYRILKNSNKIARL